MQRPLRHRSLVLQPLPPLHPSTPPSPAASHPRAASRPPSFRSLTVPVCAASEEDPLSLEQRPRGSYPVQLRVYNIDRWGLAPVGGKLLRKEVDGIYHVAVAVHGHEYWFDH